MNTLRNADEMRWRHGDADDVALNQAVVKEVSRLIKAGERERLRSALDQWPPTDIVELFLTLPLKRARKLFAWRGREPSVLLELEQRHHQQLGRGPDLLIRALVVPVDELLVKRIYLFQRHSSSPV